MKGRENSVTRHYFDVGTWFCMVLNMYNKKRKVVGVCPNICFFSVSPTRKWHFPRRIPHIYGYEASRKKRYNCEQMLARGAKS
ncbi:hypothetical protein TSAR_015145 [Trichomalopsis sarcophagae]|uniref:Uncharacterized protein n=1 Tax=Trichomalopsis sarcophagae TaxID=543379 RepID=A0A232EN06_9HYME|nr:hypothetical protein TSAR_015145 [Trichomalopsis sarcophagae]